MIRFHYFRQEWLATPHARRWQRFHLFWPNGRKRGIGVTVWRHEFSVAIRSAPTLAAIDALKEKP